MKKFIFGVVCAIALSIGFTACNTGSSNAEVGVAADSVEVVDSLAVDSVAVDTVAVDSTVVAE